MLQNGASVDMELVLSEICASGLLGFCLTNDITLVASAGYVCSESMKCGEYVLRQ